MEKGDKIIDVSVIDFMGKLEGGIGLILSIKIFDTFYEVIYWFTEEGNVRLVPEPKMLEKLNVNNIYEYDNFDDLVLIIHNNIPNIEKIIEEFA